MSLAVLLATYNGERYLKEQIDSLLSQTYNDFIVYIHDDGSSDKTVEILSKYEQNNPGKIRILTYAGTGGARNNFFSLLQRVEADYYMFCDQDDVWLPDKIEISFKTLSELERNNPDRPALVFTDLIVVDHDLRIQADSFMAIWKYIPEEYKLNNLLRSNIAPGCTIICNKPCRDIAVQIKNIDNFEMHDHLLMLVAKLCGETRFLNRRTILYRQHENNTLGAYGKSRKKWLEEKIKNVMTGTQIKSSYKTIENQRKVISELTSIPYALPQYKQMMEDLGRLSKSDKIERIKIYRRYKLLKNDWKDRWKIILV